jgi:hypothetical protein
MTLLRMCSALKVRVVGVGGWCTYIPAGYECRCPAGVQNPAYWGPKARAGRNTKQQGTAAPGDKAAAPAEDAAAAVTPAGAEGSVEKEAAAVDGAVDAQEAKRARVE